MSIVAIQFGRQDTVPYVECIKNKLHYIDCSNGHGTNKQPDTLTLRCQLVLESSHRTLHTQPTRSPRGLYNLEKWRCLLQL
jgi:hypothetical protein